MVYYHHSTNRLNQRKGRITSLNSFISQRKLKSLMVFLLIGVFLMPQNVFAVRGTAAKMSVLRALRSELRSHQEINPDDFIHDLIDYKSIKFAPNSYRFMRREEWMNKALGFKDLFKFHFAPAIDWNIEIAKDIIHGQAKFRSSSGRLVFELLDEFDVHRIHKTIEEIRLSYVGEKKSITIPIFKVSSEEFVEKGLKMELNRNGRMGAFYKIEGVKFDYFRYDLTDIAFFMPLEGEKYHRTRMKSILGDEVIKIPANAQFWTHIDKEKGRGVFFINLKSILDEPLKVALSKKNKRWPLLHLIMDTVLTPPKPNEWERIPREAFMKVVHRAFDHTQLPNVIDEDVRVFLEQQEDALDASLRLHDRKAKIWYSNFDFTNFSRHADHESIVHDEKSVDLSTVFFQSPEALLNFYLHTFPINALVNYVRERSNDPLVDLGFGDAKDLRIGITQNRPEEFVEGRRPRKMDLEMGGNVGAKYRIVGMDVGEDRKILTDIVFFKPIDGKKYAYVQVEPILGDEEIKIPANVPAWSKFDPRTGRAILFINFNKIAEQNIAEALLLNTLNPYWAVLEAMIEPPLPDLGGRSELRRVSSNDHAADSAKQSIREIEVAALNLPSVESGRARVEVGKKLGSAVIEFVDSDLFADPSGVVPAWVLLFRHAGKEPIIVGPQANERVMRLNAGLIAAGERPIYANEDPKEAVAHARSELRRIMAERGETGTFLHKQMRANLGTGFDLEAAELLERELGRGAVSFMNFQQYVDMARRGLDRLGWTDFYREKIQPYLQIAASA